MEILCRRRSRVISRWLSVHSRTRVLQLPIENEENPPCVARFGGGILFVYTVHGAAAAGVPLIFATVDTNNLHSTFVCFMKNRIDSRKKKTELILN